METSRATFVDADLAKRLPRLYCQEYVELDRGNILKPTLILHENLKKVIAQRRIGLPATAQLLYDLIRSSQASEVAGSELAHVSLSLA